MTLLKAMKTATATTAMAMARSKLTRILNVSNSSGGRAVSVAMRVRREEIEAFLGKSTSGNNTRMRGERRRRRGGGMARLSRKLRSARRGMVRDVATQSPSGLVSVLLLEQVLGALAWQAAKKKSSSSSTMGRALAWHGAGGPPQVEHPRAGGGVAELQGRRCGRVDMGYGGGGGGGFMGRALGAAPAGEPWQPRQGGKTCCYLGEGFLRWERCLVWSPLRGW